MSQFNFDLEDGRPRVAVVVASADVDRLMVFLAECQEARADAERYRWLRDSTRIVGDADGHLIVGPACGEDVLFGQGLDRAIDAARAALKREAP